MELTSCDNVPLRAVVLFLLYSIVSNAGCNAQRPKVTIDQGTLEGLNLTTRNNRNIFGFRGIPYAQPPIGDLRFKAPVPAVGWSGTFDAGSEGSACIQKLSTVPSGSEDCLFINVYTPRLPETDSTLLPVMVYIFGGGFNFGSNNHLLYNPTYLLDKDILLVVPNYRLGALGFLSTGDEVAPGNWGLKDQILALQWVQENIARFGGDPDQVTLVGESAGSAAVALLALSDSTEGLFHRYICQSGTPTSPELFQIDHVARAFELGEHFGCTGDTSTLLIECLRNLTATEITQASTMFAKWEIYPIPPWGPSAEPDIEGAVITGTPEELLNNGNIRDIPAIVGWLPEDGVVDSGFFYAYPSKFEELLAKFEELLPYVLNYDRSNNSAAITSALKSYYFNDDLTTNVTESLGNFTLLITDWLARFPNYQVRQHDSSSSEPWYLYEFDYRGELSFGYYYSYGAMDDKGIIAHADELIYLFDVTASPLITPLNKTMSDTDIKMSEAMVELWTSFVINGVPCSEALDDASWPRYSSNSQYLRIGNGVDDVSIQVQTSDFEDEMNFWDNLNSLMYS